MSEWLPLAFSFLVGVAFSAFYYGGLWLTLRSLDRFRHPAVISMGSFGLRVGVVLTGLYLLSRGDPLRISLWLFGFLAGRALCIRWVDVRLSLGQGS
ncbi:MAG: ATP synthase subunit I [Anaerolineales bacterium]|jgi:F1F0 ATPase subunit 2